MDSRISDLQNEKSYFEYIKKLLSNENSFKIYGNDDFNLSIEGNYVVNNQYRDDIVIQNTKTNMYYIIDLESTYDYQKRNEGSHNIYKFFDNVFLFEYQELKECFSKLLFEYKIYFEKFQNDNILLDFFTIQEEIHKQLCHFDFISGKKYTSNLLFFQSFFQTLMYIDMFGFIGFKKDKYFENIAMFKNQKIEQNLFSDIEFIKKYYNSYKNFLENKKIVFKKFIFYHKKNFTVQDLSNYLVELQELKFSKTSKIELQVYKHKKNNNIQTYVVGYLRSIGDITYGGINTEFGKISFNVLLDGGNKLKIILNS